MTRLAIPGPLPHSAAAQSILRTVRKFIFTLFLSFPLFLHAQNAIEPAISRPYRVLTAGKQITIKSTKEIKQLLVWTASGHRIVEQKELNETYYAFRVGMKEKYYFMMIQLANGKVYTEKIGILQ